MKRIKKIIDMLTFAFLGKDGKLSFQEFVKVISFLTAIFIVVMTVIRGGTIDTATLLILLTAAGLTKAMK